MYAIRSVLHQSSINRGVVNGRIERDSVNGCRNPYSRRRRWVSRGITAAGQQIVFGGTRARRSFWAGNAPLIYVDEVGMVPSTRVNDLPVIVNTVQTPKVPPSFSKAYTRRTFIHIHY